MSERPKITNLRRLRTVATLTLTAVVGVLPMACDNAAQQESRKPYGYIWYNDGAGGGGLRNYGGGIRKGMLDAGYKGAGEIFSWNTGLGVTADQLADDNYKRKKAGELAREIQSYKSAYPSAPTTLIGLSAGTAITVFTLEALPANVQVDNVVLLGASIGAHYNLTKALKRVKNELYIFTSQSDAVLRFLVPVAGTADRSESTSAGLRGFRMPAGATSETRQEYRKVSQIPWRKEFEKKGNYGGHTDTVNARFVQAYIAPMLMKGTAKSVRMADARDHVQNPDFARWKDFGIGSWVMMEGSQVAGGKTHRVRITERLAKKQKDQIVVERIYDMLDSGDHQEREFYVHSSIEPDDHPLTHKGARVQDLPKERVQVGSKSVLCDVKTISSAGDYPEWGRNPSGKVYLNQTIPGGLLRIEMKASSSTGPFEYTGVVKDFKVVR